jgi:hypothetical protein
MLQSDRWRFNRRTAGEMPDAEANVYLADTMGELGLWYRVAPTSLVGGSLQPIGGHNPFEPAALGSAILHGPFVTNFVDIYQRLTEAGAARLVTGPDTLAEAVHELMNPDKAASMAHAAWEVVSQGAEVTDRALDAIFDRLDAGQAARGAEHARAGLLVSPAGADLFAPAPLGALYAAGTARRLRKGAARKVGVPVICVGNINAGGTGKTPTTIALAGRLRDRGLAVHVVTRGHGGRFGRPGSGGGTAPPRVGHRRRGAPSRRLREDLGGQGRLAGAKAAVANGADVILLDDGFQNPALAYDLSIVVVDAHRGFRQWTRASSGTLAGTGARRAWQRRFRAVRRSGRGATALCRNRRRTHRRACPHRPPGASADRPAA